MGPVRQWVVLVYRHAHAACRPPIVMPVATGIQGRWGVQYPAHPLTPSPALDAPDTSSFPTPRCNPYPYPHGLAEKPPQHPQRRRGAPARHVAKSRHQPPHSCPELAEGNHLSGARTLTLSLSKGHPEPSRREGSPRTLSPDTSSFPTSRCNPYPYPHGLAEKRPAAPTTPAWPAR